MVRDERKLARRLDAAKGGQKRRSHGPELAGNPRLEMAERTRAMPYGGVGTMLELARDVGLMAKLDSELGVLDRPYPYTDADQVMNIALNILGGGRVLDDIEVRRNDLMFLDALGARSIPDPTTAGDDCRRFETEDVAEFDYQPTKASKSYRMLALRKTIDEERGQLCLDTHTRYFFYIISDREMSAEQVVREANDRCNQERLIEQLKSDVRALHAPLNTLHANWAYVVIASLAWTLKAWFALRLPISPRWRDRHLAQRDRILRMELRTFVQTLMWIPVQVVQTGRRLVHRVLAWRPELPCLFRLHAALDSS